jgi:phage anti-repressor protein
MDEKKQSAPEDQQLLIYDYMIEHRVLESYVRCVPNCTDLFTEWAPKRTVKDFYAIIKEDYIERYNEFLIDSEILRKWLNINIKQLFNSTIKKTYKKNIDYIIKKEKHASGSGGHNLEVITLTPEAAKKICLSTKSKMGGQVQQYFLDLEVALYKYKIVQVTEKFRSVVIAATAAIAIYYIISWGLTFFINYQPVHYGNSMASIGISLFVIVIAALNLFLDFDQIETGAAQGAPKYMEWYGAMGLMITLVWLYVEFLRLLSKLSKK